MKIKRPRTQLSFALFTFFTLTLCLPKSLEAMFARSILHDSTTHFNRFTRYFPVAPIISRSFSRYAKFDGEKDDVYIKRVEKLRELDNAAWSKALELRSAYNSDWEDFQEKYFPKPKVTENSHESTNQSVSYSSVGGSSHTSDTNGFFKGWFANDISSSLFNSKPKTNTDTRSGSSESAAPSSNNSSYSSKNSSHETSSSWDSGSCGDSGGGGGSDD